MKILFVSYLAFPLEIGGFQNQVRTIAKKLNELGHQVYWYNLNEDYLPCCDIVQIMSSDPSLLPIILRAKFLGKPVITTPMIGSRYYSNTFYKIESLLTHIPLVCSNLKETIQVLRSSDCLLPLSEFEKKRLSSVFKVNPSSIKVIPNGIADVFLTQKDNPTIDTYYPYNKYVLTVGRIEKNKNQLSLIKAVNKLGLNLIVVGEPGVIGGYEYFEECKNSSHNNIYYWGKETNPQILKQLYAHALLTVIPSYSEMVPLVAFESLSQSTPVICTKNASISCDSINGLFFSNVSVNSLCRAIKKVLKFNWESIPNDYIYTWEDIARQYEAVYLKLLKTV